MQKKKNVTLNKEEGQASDQECQMTEDVELTQEENSEWNENIDEQSDKDFIQLMKKKR